MNTHASYQKSSSGPERAWLLNNGQIEGANLAECLSVDFVQLVKTAFPKIHTNVYKTLSENHNLGMLKKMRLTARLIKEYHPNVDQQFFLTHTSDTVRGWGCFLIAKNESLSLTERFDAIRLFADDPHFGVREWAWMSMRKHVITHLDEVISLLMPWTQDRSERVRRFVSESLRPRGVWCTHIQALKDNPEKAMPVLEALKEDPSVYVQHSVGNWLNDVSKHQPQWVQALCDDWLKNPQEISTIKICQRGLRTLKKKRKEKR